MALAVIMLMAGCSSDDPPARTAPSIPEPTASPTTTNPDPYAVPAVIDEAYLNRVLAALDQAAADALRSSMKERALTEESLQILNAVYSDEAFQERVNLLLEAAENGFSGYRTNPGAVKTSVNQIISSNPECTFLSVGRNYDAIATNPESPLPIQYVGLRRQEGDAAENTRNPTRWTIFYDGFLEDRSQPLDPCTSSS